jgi:Glycosyltransferase like family
MTGWDNSSTRGTSGRKVPTSSRRTSRVWLPVPGRGAPRACGATRGVNSSAAPRVSIVICSIDSRKFQPVSDNYLRLYAGQPIEIIGIHDARSLAEGYNRGITQAKGETLILSHDDIEILTLDFAARVEQHIGNFDLIGIAETTRLIEGRWAGAGDPYVYTLISSPFPDDGGYGTMLLGGGPLVVPGIQALDGVFMAMRREVATATSFDAAVFDHFHHYDLDFSYRAFRAGRRLAVGRDIVLIHASTGRYDAIWDEYKRRFEAKHREHLPPHWNAREGARVVLGHHAGGDRASLCPGPAQAYSRPDRPRKRRAAALARERFGLGTVENAENVDH